ncbi:MAG: DUF3833 family protein [Sphingomonas sp.]|uniref:DUF3833 family protein n=1 Tax=Sphingomonas sp. TaxID=28214 RepID=UPI0017D6A44A|nr:DUF3833 family protein [Sphingomonas sp.]MBA3667982.1 DUF3833 family protein [Sphingomonas sp.]
MKRAGLFAVCVLAGCSSQPPPAANERGPAFDPIAFFTGSTHGDASLEQIFKADRTMSVDSVGKIGPAGTLTLNQRISVEGADPRTRRWLMRRTGEGVYAGRLTDATGPVDTRAIGRAIRIRYPMKGGLQVEQWLVALPGDRALDNRLTVTKWGVRVASVHERIAKR